ncbi:unannotated protein [freshwater metagenome]|uniref:Unannotated protein n=1 Tax=freshwater metagenome TaxID=449393 RepID=A0A6J7EV46_9ZZZZ|nr:LemA family protein [Actinomycetota bacterium]
MTGAGSIAAVAGGVVFLAALTYALLFNGLRSAANQVITARATIDAELQRRHELIPELVSTVKASAAHERTLIEQLTAALAAGERAAGNQAATVQADAAMSALLPQVFVMAEGVPTLCTSSSFLALQHELVTTEDRLAAARRYYNFQVRDLNTLVGSAVSAPIARRHHVVVADYYGEPPD